MKALVTIVQRKISVILKEKSSFGLITDGWTVGTEHYLAVFATFICNLVPDVDSIDDILLSCSVQGDVDPDTVFIEDIPDIFYCVMHLTKANNHFNHLFL